MKTLGALLVLCGTFCLAGCFSIDSAVSQRTGDEAVLVRNYSWKLFNCIPLGSGNARATLADRMSNCALFRDDVKMELMQERLMEYAAQRGKSVSNLTYYNHNTIMWQIPLLSISIPYIFCYNEIQLSGVMK